MPQPAPGYAVDGFAAIVQQAITSQEPVADETLAEIAKTVQKRMCEASNALEDEVSVAVQIVSPGVNHTLFRSATSSPPPLDRPDALSPPSLPPLFSPNFTDPSTAAAQPPGSDGDGRILQEVEVGNTGDCNVNSTYVVTIVVLTNTPTVFTIILEGANAALESITANLTTNNMTLGILSCGMLSWTSIR